MVLVGYKTLAEGDVIRTGTGHSTITISEDSFHVVFLTILFGELDLKAYFCSKEAKRIAFTKDNNTKDNNNNEEYQKVYICILAHDVGYEWECFRLRGHQLRCVVEK